MKATLRMLLAGIAITFGAGALAADAPDPAIGTWVLNLAKSKFTAPAPKSETRTYVQTAQGVAVTYTGVNADGSSTSYKATYRYDGKDYPVTAVTGTPSFDALSMKQVNANTVSYVAKKAGKVIGTGTRTVSADGKVMTLSNKGTGGFEAVFDKR